ncbi:major facilitator superfamily domain-containing protein [Fusarium solani]|uniref:Major facilitator superfamily domain-containing protein n=1 Tax=Fusarium solani TaxID=169388 RepID=A0A9P9HXB7_FUSSL|nr:major facilitator superfamily domain-containing protein [Fusarium solani]KAH7264369.1 major facilitator superfamily domain-containing protein [Fusarium solani]
MEKHIDEAVVSSQNSGSNSDVDAIEVDWTEEEEKRLVRNGNALTDFFFEDVGITQNQFNVGQQLLSLGIVLLEIPSNIILYRLGPSKWIGSQILACKRFSWYFLGNMIASASSGLIAYGILHMRGIAGLAGWQWLFILEGIFTILTGLVFLSLFPDSTYNPVSLLKVRLFTEDEARILTKRILLDDPSKIHVKPQITKQEFKNVLTNWKLIPHIILTIAGLAPATTMGSYSPTLVRSFGYERLKSNALVSIGGWILIISNLLWGYLGDKLRMRGPLVTLGIFIFWAFAIGDRLLIKSTDGHKRFALLTCTLSFGWQWHPLNGSWMALNAGTAGERSITMAILIMSANASGIIGSQLFQQKDAPLYETGWTVIVAVVSVGLVASVVANLQYYFLNGRRIGRGGLKYSP